ncbi:malZ [Lepeophtheirus salmonis]|uniref:MalZ n=1 Tax=Lepeophtheirus salmonis TaxID=72036 RepID=A0A7R8HA46_LEPSM|nr:malZ [Lepeophtheirus salmonis]CAF2967033.1 malZ [Lepeophtheirus salmonis]
MTSEHGFFEKKMSYTLWLNECLRKFPYLSWEFFVYDQNITTNVLVNQETRSTCRLKEGFMIDCLPHMDDAIINATTCESMSCCFKSINNNREAPVCYRRLPSYRGFKISSEDIFPTEENIQDIENPPVLSKLTVNVKSLAPGHVLVAICDTSEEPGRCEKTSKNDNTKESGLNVQLLSKNKKFQEIVSRNGTVKTNLFDSSHGAIIIGQKMSEISTILSSPSMGGIITIHIFSGPKPSDVSEQIANVIGKPKLPPKWILGIHLCRSNGELMKSEAIETNFPYDSDCLDRGVVGSKIKRLLSLIHFQLILKRNLKNVSIPDLLEDTKEWKNALTFLLNSTSHPDALHISDNAPDLKIKNINNEKCDIYFSHKEVISDFGSNLCHLYNYGEHSESKKLHSDVRDIYPSIVLEKSSRSIKNLFSDFASLGIQKHGWILSSEPVPGNPEVDEWTLLQKDLQATIEYGLAGINIRSTCPCTINAKGKIRDEDACYRWFYLGAFMPAINTLKVSPNDFTSGNYKKWIKTAFQNRYKLHPYYYTTLVQGGPLVRPLFYEYPWDERTFSIGLSQVMIGDGLLLAAVTKKIEHDSGIISVYFPRGTWFDFWSGAITHGKDAYEKFICFQFDLPLFLKRGKIIPILEKKSIKNCSADGSLYIEEDKTLLFKAIRTNTVGEVVITPPNPAWTGCETQKELHQFNYNVWVRRSNEVLKTSKWNRNYCTMEPGEPSISEVFH